MVQRILAAAVLAGLLGGNIGTLNNGQSQITSGATMAQWANDGSAPKAVILAGCCTNQVAQTIADTAGSATLGTNQRTINGENHTKRLRKGAGRTPVAGSGQVLLLCVTYYGRNGAVVQHDPVIVHDIDLPPKEWQEVLTRMSEREVRRFWIPPRGHVKEVVIGDFELQPYPSPEDSRRKSPR